MGIANIINNSTTTSGGEIIRELVNASDGAGLHLANGGKVELANSAAAEFGTSDFSLEFVLNQTGDNVADNYIYFTHGSGNNRLYIYNDISADVIKLNFEDSSGSLTTKTLSYDMSADYGTPTHYAMTFDRDGDATLYKNGNSVASVDISAVSSIDIGDSNTGAGQFGSSASYGVLGTFYRFRTYNKLVDAKALYERADIDYADQYGSQTELSSASFSNTGFAGFSGSATGFTATGSANGNKAYKNQTFTDGKKFRIKFTVTDGESSNLYFNFRTSSAGEGSNTGNIISSSKGVATTNALQVTQTGDYEVIVDSLGSAASYRFVAAADVGAVNISGFSIVQIGCVTDYDLAYANENQSRMVADRSTNNVDGEMSSSGVEQTQVIKQLNSTAMRVGGTSATAATPADGEIIATGVKAETYRSARSDGDVYIQAATASDFVAIGTQASSTLLKVDGSGNVTVDGGDLKIKSPTGSMQDAELLFNSTNASAVYGATYAIDSKILSTANQSDNAYGSKLKFYTSNNSDVVTERLSIDSSGNAIIGTGTAGRLLELSNASNPALRINNGNSVADIGIASSAGALLNGAADDDLVIVRNGPYGISIGTDGATRLSINSTGQVQILQNASDLSGASALKVTGTAYGTNKTIEAYMNTSSSTKSLIYAENSSGAVFNVSGDGLATFSNGINLGDTTLSNYEQGNFTLTDASGAGLTITGGLGRYTRIGNTVHVTVQFTMPTTSDSATMKLSGLPYAVPNDNDYRGLVLNYSNKTGVEYALTEKNSDDIGFYTDAGANATNADGSGGGFYINGHYKV